MAELEEAKGAIEALSSKNRELLAEKKKIQAKYNDIDPDAYSKLIDENETLKATLDKTQKQYKADLDKLSADLSNKDKYLQKTILEDGLTKALLESGIDKTYLKPALAMLRSEAEIKQNGDAYEALIGGKALNEFLPSWVSEGDGRLFVMKTPDVGGGSRGGTTKGTNDVKKYFDSNSPEFSLTKQAEIFKTNPELYKQLKG